MLNFHILRSGCSGWWRGRGVAQQGCFSASGWRGTAGCWQGHHHRHGGPPLSSREERQGITWNIRQPYHLTLSLYEATLWSLSILDDKICRWKPAFAPCLSLPAPAGLKVPWKQGQRQVLHQNMSLLADAIQARDRGT